MSRKTTLKERRIEKKFGNVKITFYYKNCVAYEKKGSLKVNLCVGLKDYWTIIVDCLWSIILYQYRLSNSIDMLS